MFSFQNQNFQNKEHIIIDGGSTDGTVNIIKKNKKKNIKLISSSDKGIYDALNKGLKISNGKIIGILHSDDFYENKFVLKNVFNAFKSSDADLVYGDLLYISKNFPYRKIRYWRAGEFFKNNLNNGWMPPHPAVFIKSTVLKKIGGYNLNYKISSDYDFLLRALSNKNIKKYYLPKTLVKMRIGGKSNNSLRNLMNKSLEDYQIIKKNNLGGIFTLFKKNYSKIRQFF
tara:strand:+ start:299 stop:982 length:684 start_codon:yes stop_codon:yes gene_type:complete